MVSAFNAKMDAVMVIVIVQRALVVNVIQDIVKKFLLFKK